ncbi:hypothetical protein FHW84_003774 [Dyella sp. SG562]|uniref:hypothetical protein n=1 Tax=Dyella sp. SG562 TaxID=2587017 RepID=UPI0014222530|nr:hypothetical protein [Dyella sp. SG562]NII75176.1 hypothetical protein [Dyella sp. SG562]
MLGLLEDIGAEGVAYWRDSGKDVARESVLKTKLVRLIHQLDQFFVHARYENDKALLNGQLVSLQDLVTGGDFEGSQRASDAHRSAQIRELCKNFAEQVAGLSVAAKLDPLPRWAERLNPSRWFARRRAPGDPRSSA